MVIATGALSEIKPSDLKAGHNKKAICEIKSV